MPREIRLIVFSPDELATAVREYLVSRREIGPVDHVAIDGTVQTPEIKVDLVVLRGTARANRSIHGPQLAAALIMFCLRRRIPLPHRTQKFLKAVSNGLALSFSQGIGPDDFELTLAQNEPVVA